jgi:putative hydrolase of the HAD superfamily
MPAATNIFFDIGGVLGTNGWDREQRLAARHQFQLGDEFDSRHGEIVAEWETGRMSLDEYLDFAVFHCPRSFTRDDFARFMFDQSEPFPRVISLVRRVADAGKVRLFTLNNESVALNVHRIDSFGLRDIFEAFFSSCWLGVRKPTPLIFERALGISQALPEESLFIDDREQNLLPARKLGLRVHCFGGDEKLLEKSLADAGAL